jgi:2-polyprenyl-6-hydroxyphenyl methylase / 3-demethylubiquinone-9 3-methyltransferase
VLAESARVLKRGGVYMFDTINRTRRSRLVLIKLMQEWRSTALMEPNLHDWDMFIKPEELTDALRRVGLECRDIAGLGPARNPIAMLLDMRRRARGDMTYGEFGARNKFRQTRDKSLVYAGYAVQGR